MESAKTCGCTGIRSCLLCNIQQEAVSIDSSGDMQWFCPNCEKLYKGDVSHLIVDGNDIDTWCIYHENETKCDNVVNGIHVFERFISNDEEEYLVREIDKEEWKLSQSGRRKQDFGPKPNFKRKKLKLGNFNGLPSYAKFLADRMKQLKLLAGFVAVELCNLEYTPDRGSSIDPHIDDVWLWGEQLVTINLLSRTFLTLTKPNSSLRINIPMSPKSLIILENEARYKWQHSIDRHYIVCKRFAMTFRNLSREFDDVDNNNYETGREIIRIAQSFVGTVNL